MKTRLRLNPDYAQQVGNFGFIELEESWGDEATIINTARISTTNRRLEAVADFTDKDKKLLFYLLDKNHGTPFEAVYFRFRFIAPIFVLRQWVKHRISTWNEFSQRYRQPITAYYIPDEKARTVDGYQVLDEQQLERYCDLMESLHRFYDEEYGSICERVEAAAAAGEISMGPGGRNPYRARARELLRNAMPVSSYSDVYWTINFRSLMNFFNLRRKPSAQYEIREYADAAFGMFSRKFPLLGEVMEEVLAKRESSSADNG